MDFFLKPGEKIDKYCIERCLGAGGMGIVYLVRNTQLNTQRALKLLDPHGKADVPDERERFIREAQLAARIQHPNMINVVDVEANSPSGFVYIVMEYVDGHTISQLLQNGPLSETQAIFIIRETARALAYAAENGIIHRDVKPANIMITKGGHVKLADLGIAKCNDAASGLSHDLTGAGTMIGTPSYASPEQCRDARSVDTRADIYSLGATLYEMLTGKPPFTGTTAFAIMSKVVWTDPVPIQQLKPETNPALVALVEKMMQKDPKNRHQTMLDLLEELYQFDIPNAEHEMTPMLRKLIESRAEVVAQERVSEILRTTNKTQKLKNCSAVILTVILLFVIAAQGIRLLISELYQTDMEAEQKRLTDENKKLSEESRHDLEKIENDKKLGVKFNENNRILLSYPKELSAQHYAIPAGVYTIGKDAFKDCKDLTEIKIPDSVTRIEDGAFSACAGLTNMNLPNSLAHIGASAFSGCRSLKNITIPNSVSRIEELAFQGCHSLTSITFPSDMASIGAGAFSDCRSLTNITLPDRVASIGPNAFSGCQSLTNIKLPDGVTSIGSNAFFGCRSLSGITIPDKVKTIGSSAFTGVKTVTVLPGNPWVYTDQHGVLFVKATPSQQTAKIQLLLLYCPSTFSGNYQIPNGVTGIEDYAFENCRDMTDITIPESVEYIGKRAFSGCSGLTNIIIPEGVTNIKDEALLNCCNLQIIAFPSSLVNISKSMCTGCNSLKGIMVSESYYKKMKLLGFDLKHLLTFRSAKTLKRDMERFCALAMQKINLSSDCKMVKDVVDTNITQCVIPQGVTCIDVSAFGKCGKLKSITLPSSLTDIWPCAFSDCSSLASISLPDSVKYIGMMAFGNGTKSITVSAAHPFFRLDARGALIDKVRKRLLYISQDVSGSYMIPDGVADLGPYLFYKNERLESVTIPDHVTSIGFFAFARCSGLKNLVIPDSVTGIGMGAMQKVKNVSYSPDFYFDPDGSLLNKKHKALVTVSEKLSGHYTIPPHVKSIGAYSFSVQRSLTEITIPDEVTSIGAYAFAACAKLEKITIPNSITRIQEGTFLLCRALKTVTIPDSVTRIEECAFLGSNLEEITIPNSVTYIGNGAFSKCPRLKSITIPARFTNEDIKMWGLTSNCKIIRP